MYLSEIISRELACVKLMTMSADNAAPARRTLLQAYKSVKKKELFQGRRRGPLSKRAPASPIDAKTWGRLLT
jgi:hypothetical protein